MIVVDIFLFPFLASTLQLHLFQFFMELFFFSFLFCSDIRNWIRNIEQHASDNVSKILVGNKADMDESKRVGIL